jgi:hypothetical protein
MHGVQKDVGSRKLLVSFILVCVLAGVICSSYDSARAGESSTAAFSNAGSVVYPPPPSSSIHAEGTKLYDAYGNEVVWNGIVARPVFGYWAYGWGTGLAASDIAIIRSHGLNFIRIDVSLSDAVWLQPESTQTPTQLNYDPRFWAKMDEIVNACTQNGIWLSICYFVADGYWANWNGYGEAFPYWMYDGSWPYQTTVYTNDTTGYLNMMRDFWNTSNPTCDNVRTAYKTFWKDIVTRYKNVPNVMFNFFNEPMETCGAGGLYPTDYTHISSDWQNMINCFQAFMEGMVDQTRAIDGGNHICIINVAALPDHSWNPQIRRPNIVQEDHNYHSPVVSIIDMFAGYASRYNQPFHLGEFGGIEGGGSLAQTPEDTVLTMQTCNGLDVSWSYLWYNNQDSAGGIAPLTSTWALIQANLSPNAKFYTP